MAKYLFTANYTAAGAKGVLSEGGSGRQKAVERLAKSVGGKVESMYWAFGSTDFYLIADVPDAAAAAALSLTVSASGAAGVTTSPLLTAADLDQAAKANVEYRAPGAKSK
ncbi:MAG TPA: GYD domain-containing protein [Candidatus Baltobacteraceae bacterium]|nr:GYD domain-containing protein [Candidatus Baltobacteraceae bacterium]